MSVKVLVQNEDGHRLPVSRLTVSVMGRTVTTARVMDESENRHGMWVDCCSGQPAYRHAMQRIGRQARPE